MLAEAGDMNDIFTEAEGKQKEAVLSEYRNELEKQVTSFLNEDKLYLVGFEMTINMDEESNTFGVLESMNIIASSGQEDKEVSSNQIEKIEISRIKISDMEESDIEEKKDFLSPEEINLKNRLSDFYNIDPDNINISIQG